MIKLIKRNSYRLIETKYSSKVLFLNHKGIYDWINTEGGEEIIVSSCKQQPTDYTLAAGKYRLYKVIDEPKLTDTWHLELSVGSGLWQGYLLPTGLPNGRKKRNKIIATQEIITRTRTSMLLSNPKQNLF